MGKKRHTKNRMFISASEWKSIGGKKTATQIGYKSLPFNCCSITFTPFETPVCTRKGAIYEILNILEYLSHNDTDPVSGDPLNRKELIDLKFHKNNQGQYHCPVTYKVFNNNSHIVAIATSGNVYSNEAVQELNVKNKVWTDLISGEKFKRSDIIELQNPLNNRQREFNNFHHMKNKTKQPKYNTAAPSIQASDPSTKKILDDIAAKRKQKQLHDKTILSAPQSDKTSSLVQTVYTTGAQSGSFTSTGLTPVTENKFANENESEHVRQMRWDRIRRLKKKGYVRANTSHGVMVLELHVDYFPQTCENFITHAKNGYYNNTLFHRLIPGFMIQGGDPEGTGKGGASIWKTPFKDEFHLNWRHDGRGILSMANSGPNTNGSQFFITFKECRHLDDKHTIFGSVVHGIEVLDTLETIERNSNDTPTVDIKIISMEVLENPADEIDQQIQEENKPTVKETPTNDDSIDDTHEVVKVGAQWRVLPKGSATTKQNQPEGSAIGKYLTSETVNAVKPQSKVTKKRSIPATGSYTNKKKKQQQYKFGNFDGW